MNEIRRSKPLLGTFVEITLSGHLSEDDLLQLSERAFRVIAEIDQRMSFHKPSSELSYINLHAHREPCQLSEGMAYVLRQALTLSVLTEGTFDVANGQALLENAMLPDHGFTQGDGNWRDIHLEDGVLHFAKPLLIDLGGIAKGYAVDQAMASIDADIQVVINAGGDLSMRLWQGQEIMIRAPGDRSQGLLQTMLRPALATSACYYHGDDSAIVAPTSREPLHQAHSYSVFAPNCLLADALTKVLFLDQNCASLLRQLDAVGLVLCDDGQVHKVL